MKNLHINVSLLLFLCVNGCNKIENKEKPPELPPATIANINIEKLKTNSKEDIELSSYSSEFDLKNKNRSINIALAATILDDTILKPGQEFGFNKVIGERTKERGFKEATIIFLSAIQKGWGGGICQVSSTLYAAAMYGGIDVTRRTSHTRPSKYIDKGLDAAVSFPGLDFRFINNFDNPIIIKAKTSNHNERGIISIRIVGVNNPFDSVKHTFKTSKSIPYERRTIVAPSLKDESRLMQKGRNGLPGVATWVYNHSNKTKIKKVESKYKSIPEIWYVKPSFTDGGL